MAKTKTAITRTEPSEFQLPYLKTGFDMASGLLGRPFSYYPGTTIAPFSSEQLLAQSLGTQRALAGSPLTEAGKAELLGILGGKYLSPESNPYLSAYVQRGFEETLPQLDTSAVSAGRYGSGAWGQAKGRAMADIASNIYGQAYEAERGRQMAGLQIAPTYSELDWADISRLSSIGAEKQAMEQALINENIERFEFGQMEPWQRLANYLNLVSGQMGGTTYSTRGK